MNPAIPDPATVATASRLCKLCGLCCNGAMFHQVMLQPADSAKALAAVGLRLKHKRGASFIQQPCPSFKSCQCSIYTARPERCRAFECRVLHQVDSGKISEAEAMETILQAKALEAEVEALLAKAGNKKRKLPLAVRCERVLKAPPDPSWDATIMEPRERLRETMQKLSLLLSREFRVLPQLPKLEPVLPPPTLAQPAPEH